MSGKVPPPTTGLGRPFSAHSQSQRVTSEPYKDLFLEPRHTHKTGELAVGNVTTTGNGKKHGFEDLQSRATATMGTGGVFSLNPASATMKNSHQRTTSGDVVSAQGERRVFNFQLDSAFRMDLMKKRMGNKIDLKTENPKLHSNGTHDKPLHSSTFMEVRKQSLEVNNKADKTSPGQPSLMGKFGELKSAMTTTHNYQPRKTAQDILENMPNKQTLMGMIDSQKIASTKNPLNAGSSKLQDWRPGTAISDLTDLKGLKTGITMVRNSAATSDWRNDKQIYQTMGGDIKKEPVSIVRVAHIVQQQKQPLEDSGYQTNDESRTLIARPDQTPKSGTVADSKDSSGGVPSYLFGGLERVFKKRASEQDFGRMSGFERKTEEPRMGSRAPRSQSREVHEVKTQNYYMVSLKYNYKKATGGPLALAYK